MFSRILALIKKDKLLLGKNLIAGIGLSIAVPLLMGFSLSEQFGNYSSMVAYLSSVLYTILILYFYIGIEESKYPKTFFLLSSIYTKIELVLSRYLSCIISLCFCTIVFMILSLIFSSWLLNANIYLYIICIPILLTIFSLYIPCTYRWTIDVNKYIISAFLLVFSAGGILFFNRLILFLNSLKHIWVVLSIAFIISLVLLFISVILSIKFLNRYLNGLIK
ncbi:ABC-2 transporter permease [Enterococcus sp. CSURQ0835]|uniref:ABC-2 transporter permease n=1 Tax=Enterococcus sp. CSURQ0835 TaxID=2681394 RepID=UPI00135A0558